MNSGELVKELGVTEYQFYAFRMMGLIPSPEQGVGLRKKYSPETGEANQSGIEGISERNKVIKVISNGFRELKRWVAISWLSVGHYYFGEEMVAMTLNPNGDGSNETQVLLTTTKARHLAERLIRAAEAIEKRIAEKDNQSN